MTKTKKNTHKKTIYTKTLKKLKKQVLPKMSKKSIANLLYPDSLSDALEDFNKLKVIKCSEENNSVIGSKLVNYFTAVERLNTKGRRGISFYDTYYNFNDYYNEKKYFRNGINNVFKNKFFSFDNDKKIKSLKSFFSLYMGNVGIFRPIIAKNIICKYNPKRMLDFTMGWGGRLVAACSENIEAYIGIDMNTNLKKYYNKMVKTLKTVSDTKVTLYFKDATTVDYSKLDYDFVLTSPPYYNIEIYNKNKVLSKDEWKQTFYIPIFTETYKHLKKNGHYCLNVPEYIYTDICIDILGQSNDKIPLSKVTRKTNEYSEYIYIWHK